MPTFISNTIQAHVAAFFPKISDYVFLALRRSANNPVYPGIWQTVTGRIESGETALQAALRELSEETSLMPAKAWTLPYVAQFFNTRLNEIHSSPVFAFLIDYEKNPVLSSEHDMFEWLGYEETIRRMPLPSHKEGTRIFKEYILDNPDNFMFEIELPEI